MEKHEQDTQDCLAIKDNKSALSCLKKLVKEYSDSDVCRPKLVLLVQKGCGPCKEEMALHADDIAAGIIEKISSDSERGLKIVERNQIEFIPSLLLLDCKDNIIEPV